MIFSAGINMKIKEAMHVLRKRNEIVKESKKLLHSILAQKLDF